ncbi:MAG: hypothetical protein H0U87_11005 [Acidobacteria bacterium]|jgi:hypothetical protein|nr:hypothetical protein [Acidobacteriota bacterium]
MNEDYLWNKTGAVDPEIERLENALQAFRYRETAPPAVAVEILPAAVLPFRWRPARQIFPLLAAAACVAFILIGTGAWLKTSNGKIGTSDETAEAQTSKFAKSDETISPSRNEVSGSLPTNTERNNPTVKNTRVENIKETETQKSAGEKRLVATSKIVRAASSRKSEAAARNETGGRKTENQEVRLTDEEQHAYSQLILALSITNSKLKLVKDKLENVREQTAVLKDGR